MSTHSGRQRYPEPKAGATDEALLFTPRMLCQVSLPYKDPGPTDAWVRRNGTTSLAIEPGVARHPETGQIMNVGYPYGGLPRLVLTFLATNAIQTGSPEIDLGGSWGAFARGLGLSGDTRGRQRLKGQMFRLAHCYITYTSEVGESRFEFNRLRLIRESCLWISGPGESPVPPTVVLDDDFFHYCTEGSVPVHADAISELKSHAGMALDVYMWLVHRLGYLKSPCVVSWAQLQEQFGTCTSETRYFRRDFRLALDAAQAFYPEARCFEVSNGVRLQSSPRAIQAKELRKRNFRVVARNAA